ncbi:hypothetical protein H7F15_06265 [Pontibacter sp. Tf4]|uniref:hypothetical protein n=1 Tax=Pontibacter sp. Tf4 TaxID=2761620 RepID=UPI0016253684|nr:hypothetical protein [Pontibacter sp. Tf4]MBB6610633.1 hypothetical protein [Pontibacter sp. Tf4]
MAPVPEQAPLSTPVPETITEASGIADSKRNPGHLWVQEDGGNPAQLYLLKHTGEIARTVYLKGAANRDWEDMALAGNHLYIADIGDNNREHTISTIYKFEEPPLTTDTVRQIQKIQFRYPDGPHDAEAFLVDPVTETIYLITKNNTSAQLFKVEQKGQNGQVQTAERVGSIDLKGVVSASLSDSGQGIILKTYKGLYYFKRNNHEPISKALQTTYTKLPYKFEPQGEAVCFSVNGKGYYTLSEKVLSGMVSLHFYTLLP